MGWVIDPDSADCMEQTDGLLGVAVVKVHYDGSMEHDSCWETVDGAAARIRQLETEQKEPGMSPVEDVTATEPNLAALERAAELADRVNAALGLLAELSTHWNSQFAQVGDVKRGDLVRWDSSGGTAYGKVTAVVTDGMAKAQPTGPEMEGTRDEPAYEVQVWNFAGGEWESTDTVTVHRAGALTVIDNLPKSGRASSSTSAFTAIPPHDTPVDEGDWPSPDGEGGMEVNVRSPETLDYFSDIYAWRDSEADPSAKSNYRFIHHFVSSDGQPGAASTRACSTAIGILNGARGGTTIPQVDREGVYEHLANHLRDADREPPALMAQDEYELALAAANREFTAIRSHSTGFSDDPWDGPENETKVKSPAEEGYFADVYAWRDDEADTSVKSSYRFIHHFVSDDGDPGAASTVACSTGIGVLNGGRGGTTIPAADREGVYNHLARHLEDAGREAPALMSQEDYEMAVAESNAALAEELATDAEDGGLAGLAEEELIAELARRWAEGLEERIKGDVDVAVATDETQDFGGDAPLIEVEVEIDKGGKADKGAYCCAMAGEWMDQPCAGCPDPALCAGGEYGSCGTKMADDDSVEAADLEAAPSAPFDWEGVLIVEGIPSGDSRMIAEGALTWRELPIPLMLQTVNAAGHDGAVIAGSIHEIVREGQNIVGRGYFDSGEAGQEAMRLLTEGTMRGVSADIDSVVVDFVTPEGDAIEAADMLFGGLEALEVLTAGRIMGATLTPFPAFQEAFVQVLQSDESAADPALVASGVCPALAGDVWRVPSPLGVWVNGEGDAEAAVAALVASAGTSVQVPANPPRAWFEPGEMLEPEPFTVHADGRCYGLVAQWGSCHIGFTDRCVQVPRTGSAYRHFRNKTTLTAEGDLVATGPVFMDTVHPNLRLVASDAQAFYADTGCAVADVALYENEFGIVAAGALRPGLSPEQVRRFRGSDVSPDWRTISGRLEVVGLLSVNVSGFIVEGLVASGGDLSAPRGVWDSVAGEVTALVAAGMIRRDDLPMHALSDEVASLRAEVAELREALRPFRAERAAAALSSMLPAACGCGGSCGCG